MHISCSTCTCEKKKCTKIMIIPSIRIMKYDWLIKCAIIYNKVENRIGHLECRLIDRLIIMLFMASLDRGTKATV